jgi:hypothetical protein
VRLQKICTCSETAPPEKLDPGDDDRGAPDHHLERLEGLLLAEPRDLFDQELHVGLNGTEIDVLGILSRHEWVVIVWHVGSRQSRGYGVSAKLRRSFTASPRSMGSIVMPHYG